MKKLDKPKLVVPFEVKRRLLLLVAAQRDLSWRAKSIFWILLWHHHNSQTGRCNPTRETLAKELGTGIKTIERGLAELEAPGWISRKFTRGAPYYSFPFERKEGATYVVAASKRRSSDTSVQMLRHFCPDAATYAVAQNTKNIESTERAKPSPLPAEGQAQASLKSIQQERKPKMKLRIGQPKSRAEQQRAAKVSEAWRGVMTAKGDTAAVEVALAAFKTACADLASAQSDPFYKSEPVKEAADLFAEKTGQSAWPWLLANEALVAQANAAGPAAGVTMLEEAFASAAPVRDVQVGSGRSGTWAKADRISKSRSPCVASENKGAL